MSYLDNSFYKPVDQVCKPKPLYESIKIDPLPTYKPLDLDLVYKPKPLYEPIKLDPLPTYKPLDLDLVYKPKPLHELIKPDPPPTYKPPEPIFLGRWCPRKMGMCYEPVCRRKYGLPGKHLYGHLMGHHKHW